MFVVRAKTQKEYSEAVVVSKLVKEFAGVSN